MNERVLRIKLYLKENNITYEQLSEMSNVPLNTLKNIFSGRTQHPRIDTLQAIEHALGIDEHTPAPAPTGETAELFALLNELTEEELQEISSFVDFVISKRK